MQTYEAEVIDGITDRELKSNYDAACKRVLAIKKFSSRILKAVTEEYKDTDIDEIMKLMGSAEIGEDPVDADIPVVRMDNTEDITLNEGKRLFDIKFTAAVPDSDRKINLIINMEAHDNFSPGYPLIKRGMYYCSRLMSSQYGTIFTGSDYRKLRKVYSIWICTDPDKAHRNTITRYEMTPMHIYGEPALTEAQRAKEKSEYDLMTLIFVCLGGSEDGCNSDNEIIRMLSVILSDELSSMDKKSILEKDYDIAMTKDEYKEVEHMCNLSEGIEARAKEKYLAEGEARAKKKYIAEGKAEIVKAMYEKALSPEEIASLTNISINEVKRIIGALKK